MTAAQSLPTTKYPNLAKPLEFGAIKSRNRNFMASLTRNRAGSAEDADNTVPGQDNFDYYTQRARGGVGVLLTEGTLISRQGTEWKNVAGLWNQEQADAWKKIVDAVHAEGAAIVLQSWHVGRIARADTYEGKKSGKPVYAPSAIACRGGNFREVNNAPHATPTAIEDPNEIIEQYRNQAKLAKQVGFDGIELHSANGYLVSQFLDYTSNKRTDQWGGSMENRCRFGLAALDALISEMGADRVGIKLNPCGGYNDVGMELDDQIATYKYYIGEIEKRNIAYIQLVRYVDVMDPEYEPGVKRAVKHDVSATYPPLIKNAKVLLNGQFDAAEADKTIASGQADGIVFGVPWIGNPDLYERQQMGIELNQPNPKTFYATPEGKPNWIGYSDYEFSKETPSGKRTSLPEHVKAAL